MLISQEFKALPCMAASAAAETAVNGTSIDTLGYDQASFCIQFGATVAADVTVQVSENNSTWLTVTDESVAAVAASVTVVDCLRLDRRYVRVRVNPDTATDIVGGVVLLGKSIDKSLPPANASAMTVANAPAAA